MFFCAADILLVNHSRRLPTSSMLGSPLSPVLSQMLPQLFGTALWRSSWLCPPEKWRLSSVDHWMENVVLRSPAEARCVTATRVPPAENRPNNWSEGTSWRGGAPATTKEAFTFLLRERSRGRTLYKAPAHLKSRPHAIIAQTSY